LDANLKVEAFVAAADVLSSKNGVNENERDTSSSVSSLGLISDIEVAALFLVLIWCSTSASLFDVPEIVGAATADSVRVS